MENFDHVVAGTDGAGCTVRHLRCEACGDPLPYGARLCPRCGPARLAWAPGSGKGVLRSYVIYHRSYDPDMPAPYAVSIVELDEGPRLLARLEMPDRGSPAPGMRVTAELKNGCLVFRPDDKG
ncbi:Zn-ribbon domain-containing OB-fold protein [Thauera sinica]|uniref:Zn-ribbon domain-containing OB-fold protein n=1 Tax=Thauera sinica TaxID=2665146 RepID=A0ABW1ANZ3_9RHOO|nr:OB-fold domain-containing protein [Thauera sp. K11]ATE62029.1 hypothetical protein CCZ27_20505 [Thauera sp. K11]